MRQILILFGLAKTWRTARAMCQFPEEVGGMGVCVARGCGADTWVDADENADEIGGERVSEEVREMCVF